MLDGKVAVVTGAGQGIGKAIALTLAKNGADVVISDINEETLAAAVEEVRALGRRVEGVVCNVADFDSCKALVDRTLETLGQLDVWVNNAGITRDNLLMRMTPEDFDLVLSVNLKGTFNGCKAALPKITKGGGGRIINMASVIGLMGNLGQANYAASKAGAIGLTRSLAKEYARRKITVNAIAPGYIQTPMTDVLSDKVKEQIQAAIPLNALGTPEDVANAALFLASDLASYITGQVIQVDGGMVMA